MTCTNPGPNECGSACSGESSETRDCNTQTCSSKTCGPMDEEFPYAVYDFGMDEACKTYCGGDDTYELSCDVEIDRWRGCFINFDFDTCTGSAYDDTDGDEHCGTNGYLYSYDIGLNSCTCTC